jgi:predicted short-subunit dehydrogenase-like oxidoreductase (DUF2520 family)
MQITLIGTGKVAHHIAARLGPCGHQFEVFGRSPEKAQHLAALYGGTAVSSPFGFNADSDIILFAIKDDAIRSVAAQLRPHLPKNALAAHTSGAVSREVFAPYFQRRGVFYPLQTLSSAREVDFAQVPLCVDALAAGDGLLLEKLAQSLGAKHYRVDDAQRAVLHVAAVFANNFSNHFYQIAHQIVQAAALPFDMLRPLILETALKVQQHLPYEVQTGPAAREDEGTIQKHLDYLKEHAPDHAALYEAVTESIRKNTHIKR